MTPSEFQHWCSGSNSLPNCRSCGFYKNWVTTVQLPEWLRRPLRDNFMKRVEGCAEQSGRYYVPFRK